MYFYNLKNFLKVLNFKIVEIIEIVFSVAVFSKITPLEIKIVFIEYLFG